MAVAPFPFDGCFRSPGRTDSKKSRENALDPPGAFSLLSRFHGLLSPDQLLIVPPPLLHGVQDGAHGVAQVAEGVLHPGRHLGVNVRTMTPSSSKLRRLSVRTFWLTPWRSFFSSLNRQGAGGGCG